MLEKFILKPEIDTIGMGTRHLDYKKIEALSNTEFAQFYLELMREYRDKEGWWGRAGTPKCSECHTIISGPEELRRYNGISLHPACFRKVYAEDKKVGATEKYFDRVAALDLAKP